MGCSFGFAPLLAPRPGGRCTSAGYCLLNLETIGNSLYTACCFLFVACIPAWVIYYVTRSTIGALVLATVSDLGLVRQFLPTLITWGDVIALPPLEGMPVGPTRREQRSPY